MTDTNAMITPNDLRWYNRPAKKLLQAELRTPVKSVDIVRMIHVYTDYYEALYNAQMEFRQMTKKKESKNQFRFSTEFAAVRLDASEKASFQAWLAENGDDYGNYIGICQGDGWKISSRWDNDNDCYLHSFTMTDEDDRNANICVTSRSDNYFEAFFLNWYKVYVMYDKKRLPTEAPKQNWG